MAHLDVTVDDIVPMAMVHSLDDLSEHNQNVLLCVRAVHDLANHVE